jgi:hypothetical protein
MTDQLETPREGVMNIAASFSSVMKPRYINPVGKSQTQEGDACWLRDSSGQFIRRLVQVLLCKQQRETCTQHN